MTKTQLRNNGKKVSTFVQTGTYECYYSRPVPGVKSESTHLNVSGVNPVTGEIDKVRLDGKAVAALRKVLAS